MTLIGETSGAPGPAPADLIKDACAWQGQDARVTWRGFGDSPVRFDVLGAEDAILGTATVLPICSGATACRAPTSSGT